jgi:micrococcal nuclease
LAEVILPDGRNLNHELVKAGLGWWFRKYVPHDRDLEQLEKEPREAKRGLWSDPHAIAPWEFRKLQRSPTESQIQFSIEVTANVDSPFEVFALLL